MPCKSSASARTLRGQAALEKPPASARTLRGQAALEYLMTYGWALLILATVMAVLYSVGVFDPQQYMAEECLFQPSLQCKSMVLYKSGQFDLKINNGLGYELDGVSTTAYPIADPTQKISSFQTKVAPNSEITLSQLFGQYAGRLRTGSLERIGVEIKYKIEDDPSGKEYTTTGVVAVRVQP